MSFSPTLFQKIITPFWELVEKEENCPANDSAKKLEFKIFIRILLYYLLGNPDSARSLITDLKDEDCITSCGLISCGLSTLHDAFARYTCEMFRQLYLALLLVIPPPGIDEFKQLGQVTLVDSSVFPLAINAYWANFKENANALKMHLCLSLNQMIPACFLVTAASIDDRQALRAMIEAGVTYIADRGYLDLKLFWDIVDRGAHFVIRVRKNLNYQVEQVLPVELIDSMKFIFFQVTDELVRFNCDEHDKLYRRVSFRTRPRLIRGILVTDRFDLTTFEIIKLYCLRWQIELFFRYIKCTVGANHLINKSENGVTIQFYMILIVHLLLIAFKRQQYQEYLFTRKQLDAAKAEENNKQLISYKNKVYHSVEEFIAAIGGTIPDIYKIKKQEWRRIRNGLFKTNVQLCFDFQ
jgi:hypothetical protein